MSGPAVSVCIPAYGRPAELREALLSVTRQDFDDLEILVGDDSGDLEHVVASLGDERIRYHQNPVRLGMARNWSSTLDRAGGRYRALLMDDDVLLPGFLSATVAALDADPAVGIAFTDHYLDRAGALERRSCALPAGRYDDCVGIILRHRPLVAVSAALMRAEVWEQVRPLPDLLNADLVMHLRAAQAGWAFAYIDEPLMAYRVHAGQLTSHEARFRGDLVKAWELFEFDNPDWERERRDFLAEALIALAATHVKAGERAEARTAIARARELGHRFSPREVLVAGFARLDSVADPLIWAWRATHRGRRIADLD
jgi:glycosyltransferase involved in cell wall biosynthesis